MAETLVRDTAIGLGLPAPTLRRLANTAPHRYKVYAIPKRSGRGMRVIAQPAKEVKAVQRWLIANDLKWMPLHPAATAYVPGASIRANARLHLHNRFLLKADFEDFFPSIKEADLRAHIERYVPNRYSLNEIEFLCRMLLWRAKPGSPLEVCIGAPSSPHLSNSVMYEFDLAVANHCQPLGVCYSRYADDVALSSNVPNVLEPLTDFLRTELRRLSYPKLKLNEPKTVFTSKKFRRSVTGLVLANQGYVSLGRERKRLLSAMVHRFSVGRLNGRERTRLAGFLAFAQDVEPMFLQRLEKRYSVEVVNQARGITVDI
jgi:RNA-directed DNA polymerase